MSQNGKQTSVRGYRVADKRSQECPEWFMRRVTLRHHDITLSFKWKEL